MVSKTIDRGSIPLFPAPVDKERAPYFCKDVGSVSSLSGRASGLGPEGYEFKSHLTDLLAANSSSCCDYSIVLLDKRLECF